VFIDERYEVYIVLLFAGFYCLWRWFVFASEVLYLIPRISVQTVDLFPLWLPGSAGGLLPIP